MCECWCGCQKRGSKKYDGLCKSCDLGEHSFYAKTVIENKKEGEEEKEKKPDKAKSS